MKSIDSQIRDDVRPPHEWRMDFERRRGQNGADIGSKAGVPVAFPATCKSVLQLVYC